MAVSTCLWQQRRAPDPGARADGIGALGIDVQRNPESYPDGRFARLSDPEGNPIELWEPTP